MLPLHVLQRVTGHPVLHPAVALVVDAWLSHILGLMPRHLPGTELLSHCVRLNIDMVNGRGLESELVTLNV